MYQKLAAFVLLHAGPKYTPTLEIQLDEIVATSEACHIGFKADLHTMKIYDEISSTANRYYSAIGDDDCSKRW